MNAASHDINLLRFFFPSGVRVISAASPAAGTLAATFQHGAHGEHGAVPVVFELAKSAGGAWVQGAEFVFERGRLLLELPSPMAQGLAARVTVYENTGSARVRELDVESVWSFQRQAEGFVSALLERRPPLTSGADALDDLRLIEVIWRGACRDEGLHEA